jgi:hypothetical protein
MALPWISWRQVMLGQILVNCPAHQSSPTKSTRGSRSLPEGDVGGEPERGSHDANAGAGADSLPDPRTSPPQEPGLPAIPGISLLTSRRRSAAAPIGHAPPPQAGGPFADPVGG